MHDELLGSTQPVLSVSLEPGESIVGRAAGFAWMTDSIQLTAGPGGLSTYTAMCVAGAISFTASLPGSILPVEVRPDREYLVHRRAFLAGTPGIDLGAGLSFPGFVLQRVGGSGRAWIELPGDTVRHDLAAGASLRTHPWHIGMSDASVTVQTAELPDSAGSSVCPDTSRIAVVSGPGSVWLQSMALVSL